MIYLGRAVDDEEGIQLDVLVQRRRNTKAALPSLRKLQKKSMHQANMEWALATASICPYIRKMQKNKLNTVNWTKPIESIIASIFLQL